MWTSFLVVWLTLVPGTWSLCELNVQEPYPIVSQPVSELQLSANELVTFYCPQGLKISGPNRGFGSQEVRKTDNPTTGGDDGIYLDQQRIIEEMSGGYVSCKLLIPPKIDCSVGVQKQTKLGDRYDAEMFDYTSLLQGQQLLKDFEQYKHLLNIVWLRALRRGNWQHWLQALHAFINDDDEMSGVATLPFTQRCNAASRSLQLLDDSNSGNSLLVPAQVWAHVRSLQPTGTVADEFVLVAHNSPYLNVLELSTFCDDVCHEIPWLSKGPFGELHLVPTFGVVHCCRVDQVDKLTDFVYRKHDEQPQQVEHKKQQRQRKPKPVLSTLTTAAAAAGEFLSVRLFLLHNFVSRRFFCRWYIST